MYILELLSYLPLSSALRVRAAVRNQDGKLIQIKPKGHKPIFLRRCASDIDVIGEIVRDDVYGTAFSLLKLCRTAVDLGANIGVTSLVLLERFPSCRVIAFEPHRGNFEVLRRNLPNCQTYEAAVWSRAGAVTLEGPSDGFDRFQAHEGGPIKAYSMRDVLALAGRPHAADFLFPRSVDEYVESVFPVAQKVRSASAHDDAVSFGRCAVNDAVHKRNHAIGV